MPLFNAVEHLIIRPSWDSDNVQKALSLISSNIISLHVPPLDSLPEVLELHIAKLSHLQELHIHCANASQLNINWPWLTTRLPALCHLSLPDAQSSVGISHLFKSSDLLTLTLKSECRVKARPRMPTVLLPVRSRAISITVPGPENDRTLLELADKDVTCYTVDTDFMQPGSIVTQVENLVSTCPSLQVLSWTNRWDGTAPLIAGRDQAEFTFRVLRELSKCSHLTILHLELQVPILMSDQDAQEFFTAMPQLESCFLSPTRTTLADIHFHPQLTMLSKIASQCTRLRALDMCIRMPNDLDTRLSHHTAFERLERLRLYFVNQIQDIELCAMYVVEHVQPFCDTRAAFSRRWMQHPHHCSAGNTKLKRQAQRLTDMIQAATMVREDWSPVR